MVEGWTRNAIARELEIGAATVSRIADAEGHTFDRSATAAALQAKSIDVAAKRTELAKRAVLEAERILDDMRAPTEYLHWQPETEDVSAKFVTHVLDEPTIADKRNLATTFGILVDKVGILTRAEGGGITPEEGISVVRGLEAIFGRAGDALEAAGVDPTRVPTEEEIRSGIDDLEGEQQ